MRCVLRRTRAHRGRLKSSSSRALGYDGGFTKRLSIGCDVAPESAAKGRESRVAVSPNAAYGRRHVAPETPRRIPSDAAAGRNAPCLASHSRCIFR
jgi:hypothetical protein